MKQKDSAISDRLKFNTGKGKDPRKTNGHLLPLEPPGQRKRTQGRLRRRVVVDGYKEETRTSGTMDSPLLMMVLHLDKIIGSENTFHRPNLQNMVA